MHSQKYLKIWIIISMINTIVFMLNSGSLLSYIITGVIAGLSWVVAALHFINMVNYFEKEAKREKRTQYWVLFFLQVVDKTTD